MPLGIETPGPRFTVRPEIRVDKLFGPTQSLDLSDRLLSYDITATKDEAASRGTFVFERGRGVDSLSAAISLGLTVEDRPALDPNLWIYLYVSINGAYRQLLWLGRIDRVNVAGTFGPNRIPAVTVTCRDFAATALNGVMRYTTVYDAPQSIVDRINQVSSDATAQGSHLDLLGHIVEPVATGWVTNPYTQEEMTVMEAGRRLVQTFGGDFRVKGSVGFDKLCILNPERSPSFDIHHNRWITDATIGPDRYTDVSELTWGDEDVRNQWEGWYQHPTTGLPVGPIYAEDADSILRYGPRYARVYLDRVSNIDTDPEMEVFLAAALADSKDPFASHRITLPFYPDVELDDIHTYVANGQEYDRDLYLAVVAFTHHWESTPGVMPTTTIGARGNRIGAYREYRRSVPPKSIVTTLAPTTEYAPEGTVIYVRAA